MLTALNGKMPAELLGTIDGAGHRLRTDAAASVARMHAVGLPTGNVTSAYRSLEEQRVQYALYLSGQGASALPPGRSQHGEGLAVDWPEPQRTWMHEHGAEHGWTFTVPGEPWHAQYDPSTDQHAEEDKDMPTAQEIAKAVVDELMGRGIVAGDAGLPAAAPFGALIGDMAVHARKAAAAAEAVPTAEQTADAVWSQRIPNGDDNTEPQPAWTVARDTRVLDGRAASQPHQ